MVNATELLPVVGGQDVRGAADGEVSGGPAVRWVAGGLSLRIT
jgi:hypothetical protein